MEELPGQKPRRRREYADPSKVDRLPPHSIEAEQGVIGCILLSPDECMPKCVMKFRRHGKQVFYDLRHQTLYEVMEDMYERLMGIDLITFGQLLKSRQQLEAVGGLVYISSLPDAVPSAANLEYYLEIVLEKFKCRKVIQACTETVGRVYDKEEDIDTILDENASDIQGLRQSDLEDRIKSAKELVHHSIETIERMHDRKEMLGLSTGFVDLDKLTNGLEKKDYIIIAARPSVGKTSLVMNIAEHVCVELKRPVGVFSLEMPAEALMLRMLCSRARVNIRNIRDGFMSERDFPKLTGAAGKLASAPIYIDDKATLSTSELKAKARQMMELYGIELFLLDYLQLMHGSKPRNKKNEEVADISATIKGVAKDLNVPFIALSQLDRGSDREKRKPKLSDLKESGSLEQDGDKIILLSLVETDADERFESDSTMVDCDVAKQRNGATGTFHLTFFKSYTRFESAAMISGDDLPPTTLFNQNACAEPEPDYNRDEQ